MAKNVNLWIAKACIQARGTHTMRLGLREVLIGETIDNWERIWHKLYTRSTMNGRRGALICAMVASGYGTLKHRG